MLMGYFVHAIVHKIIVIPSLGKTLENEVVSFKQMTYTYLESNEGKVFHVFCRNLRLMPK